MKKILFLALPAILMLAASCGLSEKEKIALLQAQKAHDESLSLAKIQQVKDEETLRSSLRDSITSNSAILVREQNAMVQLRTTIYMANEEMTQIKGFHFGRLPQDRAAQIQNQEARIQTLLLQQNNLQTVIQNTINTINQFKIALAAAR